MPKKKRRKKADPAKHGYRRKAPKRTKGAKTAKRRNSHGAHAQSERASLPLLRAMKRRRAAENGEHLEFDGLRHPTHHTHSKRRSARTPHKSQLRHGEPVITEKSFENMLAYRRFQDHAR